MTREQFIAHVEGCQKALRNFLTALCCGDSHLADDIAQETLIKAWLSADGFKGNAAFSTWIRKIAYNTFLNSRRYTNPSGKAHAEVDNIPARESADSAFRYQALYSALGRLNGKERTSILLYYLEGYSIKEIAGIESTSESAVKQHLSRGRSHLRTLLNPDKNER